MTTPDRNSSSRECVIELEAHSRHRSQSLRDYLSNSTLELQAIARRVALRETIDRDSRDWMLAQVDFIVETIGDESQELADGMRSNLLQLLLAIASLNEQICRRA